MLLPCSGRRRKVPRLPGIAALLVLPAILTSLSGYILLNADQVERSAERVAKRGVAAALVAPVDETFVELVDASDQALGKPAGSATANPVTVVADGQDLQVAVAEGATVGTVLQRLNLQVDQDDRVSPPLTSKIDKGTEIVVQRITTTVEVRQVVVPPPVVQHRTADLPEGSRREVSEGQEGMTHVVEEVTWVDGVPTNRVRTGERVVSEPEARIIDIGITSDDEDDDDEESDSGDNAQTGGASWYVFGDEMTAAHRTLPKGTMVMVTNLSNGKTVNVRINDRGPFIDGRVIDLNKVAFEEIASPSQGVINVRISW
ncbi:MAG: septal ring lytic transglycosylase RlpA family protein [Egibacteraceae bacterium]